MNRILLKNIMSLMFWLYTGSVLAVPVEEVRRNVDEFLKKKSEQRQEEIRWHELKLEELKRNLDAKYQQVNDKENEIKVLKVEHNKKELIDFLDTSEFKQIKERLIRLGLQDNILDVIREDKYVTGKDLRMFFDRLPSSIEINRNVKFSEEEIAVLQTFLNKTVNFLKEHIDNISIDDVSSLLPKLIQPYDQQYKAVKSSWASINYNLVSNHLKQHIMLYGILALNILAILLMITSSKSSNQAIKKLASGILVTALIVDMVGGCLMVPNACRFMSNIMR